MTSIASAPAKQEFNQYGLTQNVSSWLQKRQHEILNTAASSQA
jgi:hypothetical protein